MSQKKSRAAKSGLNYENLIHYMKYDCYPKEVTSEHEKRNIRKRSKSFRLEQSECGDTLYFVHLDHENVTQEKEVVYTNESQQRAFDEFHINSKGVHLGREKLLNIISEKYYWQGICGKIKDFLMGCRECRQKMEAHQSKRQHIETFTPHSHDYIGVPTKVEEDLDMEVEADSDLSSVSFSDSWITSAQQTLEPSHFWDIVEVKLLGPYLCNGRMKHVMMFMDVFSLWPEAAIVETLSPTVVTHVIINLICRFGVMNKLLIEGSDDIVPRTDVLHASDINVDVMKVSVVQTVDAWNEVNETMTHFVANNSDWTNCLSFALLPHRISRGRNTEYSSAFLTYGRELELPISLTHQPSAEYLQTGDGYLPIDKKKQTINSLMALYKGYCGPVNISQDSDVFKTPTRNMRVLRSRGTPKTPTPSNTSITDQDLNYEVVENIGAEQNNESVASSQSEVGSSSLMSEDEGNTSVSGVRIKTEIVSTEEQEKSTKGKRWSKTHQSSMDNSSNKDMRQEELDIYLKLLEIDENNVPEKLMESKETDHNYDALILYLTEKKYPSQHITDHTKRGIRKMSESHFIKDGILYHKWKADRRVVPLRFDERYYILEAKHVDEKGKHIGFRNMYENLSKFYWKGMSVDCEAYVRTCVHCNQTKSVNNENLPEYFYDDTDETRAKLAEENYSLLVKYLQKGKILQSVQPNRSQLVKALANWFILKNGQLYYKRPNREYDVCLEVATRAKKNAIKDAHFIAGIEHHAGHLETLQTLSEKFIWSGMKENCEDFVTNCCKPAKPGSLKRNAAFKKYDLLQRVSVFMKIREMQENPEDTEKYNSAKTTVLEKYKNVLDKIDNMEASESFKDDEKMDEDEDDGQTETLQDENINMSSSSQPSQTENIVIKDLHIQIINTEKEDVGEGEGNIEDDAGTSQDDMNKSILNCSKTGSSESHMHDIGGENGNMNGTEMQKCGVLHEVSNISKTSENDQLSAQHRIQDVAVTGSTLHQVTVQQEVPTVSVNDTLSGSSTQSSVITTHQTAAESENDRQNIVSDNGISNFTIVYEEQQPNSEAVTGNPTYIQYTTVNTDGVDSANTTNQSVGSYNTSQSEVRFNTTSQPGSSYTTISQSESYTTTSQSVGSYNNQQILVEDTLILISDGNVEGLTSHDNVSSTTTHVCVERADMASKASASQVTQTDYNSRPGISDDDTLSAVRSILPADRGNETNGDETESENEGGDNDPDDPDWEGEEGDPTKDQRLRTNVIETEKEPDWEDLRKRYDNKTRFRCKFCGKCVKGIIRYRSHVYEHTGVKPYVCDHCPKRFTTTKTRKIHMMRHTGAQQFLCNLCGKGFSTAVSLKSHIAVHEKGGNVQVKCELCPRMFTSRNRYEKHMKFKHPPKPDDFRCEECGRDFTTRRSLVRHNKSLHQKIKGHMCEICGKGFYRKEYLKSHLTTHGEGTKSEKCYVKRALSLEPPTTSGSYEIALTSSDVTIPQTVQYTTAPVIGENDLGTEYSIPLSESHIAMPSTTVENQMTVESIYISDENQVAHMLVYEQPAVQYEVECGSSGEQIDAAEALSAINMLAQASISQGY